MSQVYWNEPVKGYAMSAEEFAAGSACRQPGPGPQAPGCGPAPAPECGCGCGCGISTPAPECGCGGAVPPACPGQEEGCCQQIICCCRPAAAPQPRPPQVEEGCCCKQSFRAALGLLCDERIASLLDFDTAAFITDTYTAGAALVPITPPTEEGGGEAAVAPTVTPADNLGVPTGSFRRFAPCSCDLLDVSATLYSAAGAALDFTAGQVNLCQLDAVMIQAATATAEGDLTAEEVAARNFRCLRSLLSRRLNPCGGACAQSCPSCACDGRECCCAAGLLSTLAQNNLSRRVSLAAGLLVLRNVQLLGAAGNVLVLANEASNRLYFVCVNSVQFIV